MFNFTNSHSGSLSLERISLFPCDQGRLGSVEQRSGNKLTVTLWLTKDGHNYTLQQDGDRASLPAR